MSKQFDQSKKAKEQYKSVLLTIIPTTDTISRQDLVDILHISNREVRREIAQLANYYGVIATSDRKGYRLVNMEVSTEEAIDTELEDINHQLAELNSRVEELQARMKPLIADKAVLEERKLGEPFQFNVGDSVIISTLHEVGTIASRERHPFLGVMYVVSFNGKTELIKQSVLKPILKGE